jgi:hypothetical protein
MRHEPDPIGQHAFHYVFEMLPALIAPDVVRHERAAVKQVFVFGNIPQISVGAR